MTRLLLIALIAGGSVGLAQAAPVELHFFWAATCPHCEIMKTYLSSLVEDYPELNVVDHEVGFDADNWRLMVNLAHAYGVEATTTPVVIVGDVAVVGIGRAVELRIAAEVARCVAEGCASPLTRLPERPRWRPSPLEMTLVLVAVVGLVVLLAQLPIR
jgi:glutaredoxin